jgi:hypothetical protein
MKADKEGGPPIQNEVRVLDETIAVEPGAWNAYSVPIDLNRMPGCHLTGAFSVAGGYGNDIEVLVFYERGYKEWERRMETGYEGEPREVPALYRSGRVTVASFDIPVPRPDTYYIVFNNQFSNFSLKEVTVRIYLNYGV